MSVIRMRGQNVNNTLRSAENNGQSRIEALIRVHVYVSVSMCVCMTKRMSFVKPEKIDQPKTIIDLTDGWVEIIQTQEKLLIG